MDRYDVIVVGAGAAGLFCAATAGARGRRVLVLEHNSRPGNKILISGGGRCNFTNLHAGPANYVTSGSPHFVKSALARFRPADFIALVDRHGIAWHEKKLGQLFCDHSSKQILQMLEAECSDAGVALRCGVQGITVRREASREGTSGDPMPRSEFIVGLGTAGEVTASSLVIATGGLSFPKLGATPFGYRVAEQFGLRIVPPRPGLVPLVWPPQDVEALGALSGLSLDCELRAGPDAPRFRENLLFTHRGISGPSVLQISSHWRPGEPVRVDLLPGKTVLDLVRGPGRGGQTFRQAMRGVWPDRFLQLWAARHANESPLAQWPRKKLEDLADQVHGWTILPAGDEGYPKAEVTVGGVDTAELSSKTLESRRVPGLHFIGEVVDVTGWLGGFNFQWAWASAHAAGSAV
ncbi:MAG: NAD(P)/FAD-dependent oxidoreductase [Verrucomicrobiales bacterium]|nr:NAD(P)/FAD-dependent oxidoreductase [Verrucomicrobiales bacterium]